MSLAWWYFKINSIMMFEWEEMGKAALLECVRKLKHDRVTGLDFPLWFRHRAVKAGYSKTGESYQSVEPAVLRSELGTRNFRVQISGWVFLCEFPNATPPSPVKWEQSAPPAYNSRADSCWGLAGRNCSVYLLFSRRCLSLAPPACSALRGLQVDAPPTTLNFSRTLHHVTLLTPAETALC